MNLFKFIKNNMLPSEILRKILPVALPLLIVFHIHQIDAFLTPKRSLSAEASTLQEIDTNYVEVSPITEIVETVKENLIIDLVPEVTLPTIDTLETIAESTSTQATTTVESVVVEPVKTEPVKQTPWDLRIEAPHLKHLRKLKLVVEEQKMLANVISENLGSVIVSTADFVDKVALLLKSKVDNITVNFLEVINSRELTQNSTKVVDRLDTQSVSLDTSPPNEPPPEGLATSTHTVVYSAVDGAGNWGYATRTIEVVPQ